MVASGSARLRARLVYALELLEDGDQQGAVDVLLDVLEDAPEGERAFRCECGQTFTWPGELVGHRYAAWHERESELEEAA